MSTPIAEDYSIWFDGLHPDKRLAAPEITSSVPRGTKQPSETDEQFLHRIGVAASRPLFGEECED